MLRVRVTWSGTAQSLPYLYTFYFGGGDQADADQAAAAVRAFLDTVKGRVSSGLTATVEPEVAEVSISTGEVTDVFLTSTLAVVGTDVGTPLPFATQGLLRLNTSIFIGGRRIKGHIFMPGTTENSNAGGLPEAVYRTTIDPALTTLAAIAAPNDWGVYSRKNLTFAGITTAVTANTWAVLRSRRTL